MVKKLLRDVLKEVRKMTAAGFWAFSPKQLSPVKILSPNGIMPYEGKKFIR
ncbi:MAG TPA: hypothetical protein VM012_10735 [Flavitalea sp.]|nr:hypothetical protein [Flavitalea sp.]